MATITIPMMTDAKRLRVFHAMSTVGIDARKKRLSGVNASLLSWNNTDGKSNAARTDIVT